MATVDEIAERLVALRGSDAEGIRRRNAVGLVRAAVEGDAGATLAILRHGDAVLLTAADSPAPDERLEAAAALAAAIDDALTDVTEPLGPNVGLDLVRTHPRADETAIGDPQRVLVLATRASATAAVSSRHELYPVGMDAGDGCCCRARVRAGPHHAHAAAPRWSRSASRWPRRSRPPPAGRSGRARQAP